MKAVLEFTLPDEETEFTEAIHGGMYKHVLWKFDQDLRSKLKHGLLNECEYSCYDQVREDIRNLLQVHNLNIE
jgi:hypothetical protein